MAGYDPQRNRRRPTADDTGAAPVDGLLERTGPPPQVTAPASGSRTRVSVPAPMVTPPPPGPDPDPRVITAAVVAGTATALVGAVLVRRWWRNR